MLNRAFKLSSNWQFFHQECERLKIVFARLHYPETVIDNTIRHFIEMRVTENVCSKQQVSDEQDAPTRIVLPFKDQDKTRQESDRSRRQPEGSFFVSFYRNLRYQPQLTAGGGATPLPLRHSSPVAFKDQKSTNVVRHQLSDLSRKIDAVVQPVYVSKKIKGHFKPKEHKPPIVNQQNVVYHYKCGLNLVPRVSLLCLHCR